MINIIIGILLSYVIIVLVVIVSIFAGETLYPQVFEMDPSRFLLGFAATAFQFRSDLFILVMLLPISIGLFVLARNRFQEADSVLFLIFHRRGKHAKMALIGSFAAGIAYAIGFV